MRTSSIRPANGPPSTRLPPISNGLVEATIKGALGDSGRPNLSPAVLALAAATQHAAAGSGWITAAKAAIIVIALAGVVAAGAYAFGFAPPQSWFAAPVSPAIVRQGWDYRKTLPRSERYHLSYSFLCQT